MPLLDADVDSLFQPYLQGPVVPRRSTEVYLGIIYGSLALLSV